MREPTSEERAALECVEAVIACDNQRDSSGYRALLHDDYSARVHGRTSVSNADDEVAGLARWWSACSDVRLEPLAMVASGNLVTLRYRLRGTNDGSFFGRPASGRPFETEACTLLEVIDGRVKRTWRFADTLGLLLQLGFLELDEGG